MQPLPIDPHLSEITEAVRRRGALVLVAPPGSGKTTRVPPALLESLPGSGRMVVLQPRRIAARAAAARIAAERGWSVGREVGYQVRFENRSRRETRLLVVTEGILTRMLQGNPFLEGIDCVVLDEFHERSIHLDFALAALRELRAAARPDLKLLVLSATLDPEPPARFLGDAAVMVAEGRPHPVEIRHLERAGREPLDELAAQSLREAWEETRGHALVFLPGMREIRRAARRIEAFARAADALVAPLHGSLSLEEQERALGPSERRKVILATNVAETSLTVDGVDLVIDGGLARVLRQDPRTGIDRLETVRISRRSADQRAGRAGRTGPGRVMRLWTRAEDAGLRPEEDPEIRRVDLSGIVLELRAWGINDPRRFGWFEAPDPGALERAERLLADLGAVEGPGGSIAAEGKAMLAIPAHPRLGRLVAAARAAGVLEDGAALAALIEERDIISIAVPAGGAGPPAARPLRAGPSDLLHRLDLLEEAERAGFRRDRLRALGIDAAAARAAARTRDLLVRCAREAPGAEPRPRREAGGDGPRRREELLLRLLLLAYPDRVARRRARGSDRARMTGGRGAALHPDSVVRDAEYFIAIDVEEGGRGERSEALVRVASAVRREWIEELFPGRISESIETAYDPEAEKVRSYAVALYRDLPLEEPRERPPPPAEAEAALRQAARARAAEIYLADEEARRWILRVRSLREWMPELGLPALDAAELESAIDEIARGASSLAEVRARGLAACLRARLPFDLQRAVDRHAPERLRVPSGREAPLEYEPGKPPVLAARVQEMFGLLETPAVAAGRVPVLLHLLGPNHRPVQITRDLGSFWENTYAQVRKDLRGRYPKHSWPEDPRAAEPQSRPGRRR